MKILNSKWLTTGSLVIAAGATAFACLGPGAAKSAKGGPGASAEGAPSASESAPAEASAQAKTATADDSKPAPNEAVTDAPGLQKKCDAGDAKACNRLAQGYAKGQGVTKDEAKAAALFEQACGKGLGEACFGAADLRFDPGNEYGNRASGNVKNDKLASEDAEKGCSAGNSAACGLLGRMELYGRTPKPDRKRAFELLDKVCHSTTEPPSVIGPGCMMFGYAYETGSGVGADMAKAREYYEKSCGLKHMAACSRLGDMYMTGQGGPKDAKKARQFYDTACKGGVNEACDALKDMPKGG